MSGLNNFYTWATKERRSIIALKGDVVGHEFHGNQWTEGGGSGRNSDESSRHPHEMYNADDITPLNKIDEEHLAPIRDNMKKNGWQGRPILAYNDPNGLQAVTGSHRIQAAQELGIKVPISVMKFNGAQYEDIQEFLEGKDDQDRYLAAKRGRFVKNGFITQDQFDLLKQEYDENE